LPLSTPFLELIGDLQQGDWEIKQPKKSVSHTIPDRSVKQQMKAEYEAQKAKMNKDSRKARFHQV
jgi:hypothetical protein